MGDHIAAIQVAGGHLRIGVITGRIDFGSGCRRALYHLSARIFYDSMVDKQFLTAGGGHNTAPQAGKGIRCSTFFFCHRKEHRIFGCPSQIEVAVYRKLHGYMVHSHALVREDYLHAFLDGQRTACRHTQMAVHLHHGVLLPHARHVAAHGCHFHLTSAIRFRQSRIFILAVIATSCHQHCGQCSSHPYISFHCCTFY